MQFNIAQAIELALRQHQRGDLRGADATCRQILSHEPDHADALHLLGAIAYQVGQLQTGMELVQRAIAANSSQPQFHCTLGLISLALNRTSDALDGFRKTVLLEPMHAEAHAGMGDALQLGGQMREAIAHYRQSLTLRPDVPEVLTNLANALVAIDQTDEAIAAYRRALTLRPQFAEGWYNYGVALDCVESADEAIHAYRQAVAFKPDYWQAYTNLGEALRRSRRFEESTTAFRNALAQNPNAAEMHFNLGFALLDQQKQDEAIQHFRNALLLKPQYPQALNNLGDALHAKGEQDEAATALRQAIALDPQYSTAIYNLGCVLRDNALLDEALTCFQRAIQIRRGWPTAHDALLFTLHFHPRYDAATIHHEHQKFDELYCQPLQHTIRPHSNDRNPDRKLRIGYVGANFAAHAQSFFTMPLLSSHDRANFEIFCYSDSLRPDDVTDRLRGYADTWRETFDLTDEKLAEIIRDDQIDVLVDLTMHMGQSRLLTFARKPALVQVTWLAYPGTTGVSAIDYRLSDPYLDSSESDMSHYSEKTIRLPQSFWCYDPLTTEPTVKDLPAKSNDYITFGCLNSFFKINEPLLRLWSQVLNAVPNSRMILLAPGGDARKWVLETLNVDSARIEFLGRHPRAEYLKLYNRIDICLDTYPYNGHTTSLDALWMGVPVVTLHGSTVTSRGGLSMASNLGLTELAAKSPEEFVQIATQLALDTTRLSDLRASLRTRMQASPLMDAPRFARDMEAIYRDTWRSWCSVK